MTEQERNLIRNAMMFAVKDITDRVMREATVQSMIDDFKKSINYTRCCKSDSELLCDKLGHNADIMVSGSCMECGSDKEKY